MRVSTNLAVMTRSVRVSCSPTCLPVVNSTRRGARPRGLPSAGAGKHRAHRASPHGRSVSDLASALSALTGMGARFVLGYGKGGKAGQGKWKTDDGGYVVRGPDVLIRHLAKPTTETSMATIALLPETLGLVALDFDGGGEANQRRWVSVLPEPVWVGRTLSGHYHVWYRHRDGMSARPRTGGNASFTLPRLDGALPQSGKDAKREQRAVDGEVIAGDHGVTLWRPDRYAVGLAEALTSGKGEVFTGEVAELIGRCDGSGRKVLSVKRSLTKPGVKRVRLTEALRVLTESTGMRDSTFTQVVASVVQGELSDVALTPDGVIGRALVEAVSAAGGPDDVRAKASRDYARALERRALRQAEHARAVEEALGDRELLAAKGSVSMDMVREALDLSGWEFRRDDVLRERMIRLEAEGEWCVINDDVLEGMRHELDSRYAYTPIIKGKEGDPRPLTLSTNRTHLWPVVLTRCDANATNPLLTWLGECEREAEGADDALLDSWLSEMFIVSDALPPEALRWVSRRLVCASAARVMRPGTAWPRMVILQGPQEIGKSLLVRSMLPAGIEWDAYHSDELHFGMRDAQMIYAVKGKLWVECAEMKGRQKEIEDMRTFVTRNVDGTGERLAYRRDAEPYPRTCVLVGTANNPDCIPRDPYGSRRYFVIPLTASRCEGGKGPASGRLVRRVMDARRRVLYGLAVSALRRDEAATGQWGSMLLDDEGLSDVFATHAHTHREVDEWEESMHEFIARWRSHYAELNGYFHAQEMAEYCRIVGLAHGRDEYQPYHTAARRWHGRIKEILTGKEFGLSHEARWVPVEKRAVKAWGDPGGVAFLDGPERRALDLDERRRVLGIPSPAEARTSSAGALS